MPKITHDDIIGPTGLGFTREMYSAILKNDLGLETFVDAVIAGQAAELLDRLGSAIYNDATKLTKVKKAETCLVAAEMLRRLITIVQGNAKRGADPVYTQNEDRQRSQYAADAEEVIAKLIDGVATDGSSFACGSLVTSHFEEDE